MSIRAGAEGKVERAIKYGQVGKRIVMAFIENFPNIADFDLGDVVGEELRCQCENGQYAEELHGDSVGPSEHHCPPNSSAEPPPIPSNAVNLTPWTKSNFLAVNLRVRLSIQLWVIILSGIALGNASGRDRTGLL